MKKILALILCFSTYNIIAEDEMTTSEQTIINNNDTNDQEAHKVQLITLIQAQELFHSEEGIEFFGLRGFTSNEAFNEVVNILGEIHNKRLMVDGTQVEADGLSLKINENTYFIKATEYMTINNEDYMDITSELNDSSNLNN